jgi:hypothetical protein
MEIKDKKGNIIRTNSISFLLGKMKERGLFKEIIRNDYSSDLSADDAMKVVDAFGKYRNPKFVIDDENRFTYLNLIKWLHGDASMQCLDMYTKKPVQGSLRRGVYIAGNTGTGKSWALELIVEYSRLAGLMITIDGKDERFSWANTSADDICTKFSTTGNIDAFKKTSIIGIQDLGAEPLECCFMGNRLNVLRNVIESRGDRTDAITLITSNIPMSHPRIEQLYGDRVASRLVEMCNYFEIKGVDRRKL